MNVRFGAKASDELDEATVRYLVKSLKVGEAFVARVDEAGGLLKTNAATFPLFEPRRPGREIRHLSIEGFPFSLIYEIAADEVVVLAVWNQHSRPEDWTRRRP